MPLPDNMSRLTGERSIRLDTIAEILDRLVPAFNALQREFDEHVALLQPAPADVPTDARLLAVDKRREVAERALADARQEVAMLAGTVQDLRAQLADANATAGRLAYTIAGMEQESAQLRLDRDTYRAQADAQRQAATEAAQRAGAAEARLAAFYSPRPAQD